MTNQQGIREAILNIYDKGPEAIIEFVEKLLVEFHQLKEIVQKQGEEILELKAQIKQDSHNSNKPPSADGLKRKITSLRTKSNRPSGGQNGHPGTTLQMVEKPDHVVVHPVERCRCCGRSLKHISIKGYEKRQVFDIPPIRVEVTEHQSEVKDCPQCGATTTALIPDSITTVAQYGSRLKTVSVYLMQQHLVPHQRTTELLKDLFGCDISEGTLHNWNTKLHRGLEQFDEAVKQQLRKAPVLNVDETGIFCENKLHWLHVASTAGLTHYGLHEKRGKEATDQIDILSHVEGRIIHDFWEPYLGYDCQHGFCNSHIIRELTAIVEQGHQQWAQDLIDHLYHINKKVQCDKESTDAMHASTLHRYRQRYDAIVGCGLRLNPRYNGSPHKRGRTKQSKARNLLERLRNHRDEILAFMYDFDVPFTNNLAERDLRMVKVKQKISGTFRSRVGGDLFCRIRGYISTVKKQNKNVLDALFDAFSGHPFVQLC